jgi:hypothetical protein
MKDEVKARSAFLDQFLPATAEPAEEQGLPALKEGEYQPHARPSNKPLYSLHFLTPDGNVRSFQYVHLDSNNRYTAEQVTLTFMGTEPVRITLQGRNLWRLYDYIHQHRISWVMQAVRPFAANGEIVITDLTYTPGSRLNSETVT